MNWSWLVAVFFLFLWILAMRLIYRRDKRHLYLDDDWWNTLMVLAHQHSYYVSGQGRDILISLAKERQRLKTWESESRN